MRYLLIILLYLCTINISFANINCNLKFYSYLYNLNYEQDNCFFSISEIYPTRYFDSCKNKNHYNLIIKNLNTWFFSKKNQPIFLKIKNDGNSLKGSLEGIGLFRGDGPIPQRKELFLFMSNKVELLDLKKNNNKIEGRYPVRPNGISLKEIPLPYNTISILPKYGNVVFNNELGEITLKGKCEES